MGGLRRAIRLRKRARLIADEIDHSDAFSHVHIGYSKNNRSQERRRVRLKVYTKAVSSCNCSSVIKGGRPERFLGVGWPF